MDCREIVEKLHAFHDGELTPGESWSVEAHLSVCEPCRKAAEEIRQVDARLLELPGIKASDSFDERLARRRKRGGGVTRLLKSRAVQYALAAGVVIAIGIAVGIAAFRRPPVVQPVPEPVIAVVEEIDLPNLDMLDDPDFLGIASDNAGIGAGLEVQFALSDSYQQEE